MTLKTVASSPRGLADLPLAFEALPSEVSAGVPLDLSFALRPAHPSNQLTVELRSNGRERLPVRGGRTAWILPPERSAFAYACRHWHRTRWQSIGPW